MALSAAPFFLMVIAVALSPFLIIYQITRFAHSSFRDQLWTIRDDLVDDLRLGGIEESPGAVRLLDLVQTHIDIAGRHTFADSALAYVVYRPKNASSISDSILNDSVPRQDQKKLNEYLIRFRKAIRLHLAWASPLGLVALPIVRIFWRTQIYWHKRRSTQGNPKTVKQVNLLPEAEWVELEAMPTLIPSRSARRRGDHGALLTKVPC